MIICSLSFSTFYLWSSFHVIMFFICKIDTIIFSNMVWIIISCSYNHNSFHASSFSFISFHSFSNFVHSIILFLNSLFSMVSYNIFTLTFSSFSLCFFQVTMHCLYYSYISCSCFICYNNPCFSPSTMVNLVFNDLTSKPKLPIF
jgi:hypothetical protein